MKALQAYLVTLFLALALLPSQPHAQSRALVIVAYGDSLTAGYGLRTQHAFPAKLAAALKARGHKVIVHDAGVSGDTTTGGLSRLNWSLPDNTAGIILELGGNDALRGINPAQTLKALDALLAELKKRKIPVLLAGMRAPPNMGRQYETKFNAIFPFLAKKYAVSFYPFFLAGVAAQPELNQADSIHPNETGVEVIVKNILPAVEKFLKKIKK